MEKLKLNNAFASMPSDRRFARVGWHQSPACSSDVEAQKARSPRAALMWLFMSHALHAPHPTTPQPSTVPSKTGPGGAGRGTETMLAVLMAVGTATGPQLQQQPLSLPSGRWLLLACAVARHLYLPLKLQKGHAVLQREKRLCSNTTPTPPGDSATREQT